ncbi:MAG: superoxide dismutase family protein [Gemmatimonadales bacterium]
MLAAAAACGSPAPAASPAPIPLPSPSPAAPAKAPPPSPGLTATATLRDLTGTRVGTVTLVDTYAGVLVSGTVAGLGLGAHGIHLHAVGKCEPPAFASAGGHFNPQGKQHGYRNPDGPHLGDLPNLDTPAAGELRFEFLAPGITLKGSNALLDADGASIVIHSGRDDYTTDPAGNSGARIACGVITVR